MRGSVENIDVENIDVENIDNTLELLPIIASLSLPLFGDEVDDMCRMCRMKLGDI